MMPEDFIENEQAKNSRNALKHVAKQNRTEEKVLDVADIR